MPVRRDPEGTETDYLLEYGDLRGQRVLEIGCGEGRLTWRYADAALAVVGIDVDPARLVFAPRERPPDLRPIAHFALAAAETLPFPRERFDRAVLAWSL